MGLRGQEFDYSNDDFVVLLIGDSQVEAAASPFNLMPESILQSEILNFIDRPVKVFSLASSGWGQDQQLLAMERYFENYRADLVMVWVTPGNDFWENTFPDRSVNEMVGRFKPTFRLKKGELEGPFFEKNHYYKNLALYHLVTTALNDKPVEQMILDDWIDNLPPADSMYESSPNCDGATTLEHKRFFVDIFDIDRGKEYMLRTEEDVGHSRSHFSPYTIPPTDLDNYEKEITKALMLKMTELSKKNDAVLMFFYPIREDLDKIGQSVKCIITSDGKQFEYSADYRGLIESIVPPHSLIIFEVEGRNENVVSKGDRHFNSVGNTKTMKKLAHEIMQILSDGND